MENSFDVQSLSLQWFLKNAEKEVMKSLPIPFGSFEKAKYTLRPFSDSKMRYSFVTTVHNTEDAIEIMKRKFEEKYGYQKLSDKKRTKAKYFCIIKKVGDVETKVFQTERFRP